jgi:hypothetical protein
LSNVTYLNATDFLAGIVGEEEDVFVPGVGTVRIRPLTAIEAARVSEFSGNPAELALRAVGVALVQPVLSDEQVQQMFRGAAGKITPLIQRVMAISGMAGTEQAEDLAGGGS